MLNDYDSRPVELYRENVRYVMVGLYRDGSSGLVNSLLEQINEEKKILVIPHCIWIIVTLLSNT